MGNIKKVRSSCLQAVGNINKGFTFQKGIIQILIIYKLPSAKKKKNLHDLHFFLKKGDIIFKKTYKYNSLRKKDGNVLKILGIIDAWLPKAMREKRLIGEHTSKGHCFGGPSYGVSVTLIVWTPMWDMLGVQRIFSLKTSPSN